jgi:hypothetical protein
MLTAARKLLWAGDTTGCFVVHDPPPRTQSGPGLSGISATIELTLINGIGADSTGGRNTSITEVCDGGEQEADAADARGCTPAVGSGSGVAAADAFTWPA